MANDRDVATQDGVPVARKRGWDAAMLKEARLLLTDPAFRELSDGWRNTVKQIADDYIGSKTATTKASGWASALAAIGRYLFAAIALAAVAWLGHDGIMEKQAVAVIFGGVIGWHMQSYEFGFALSMILTLIFW